MIFYLFVSDDVKAIESRERELHEQLEKEKAQVVTNKSKRSARGKKKANQGAASEKDIAEALGERKKLSTEQQKAADKAKVEKKKIVAARKLVEDQEDAQLLSKSVEGVKKNLFDKPSTSNLHLDIAPLSDEDKGDDSENDHEFQAIKDGSEVIDEEKKPDGDSDGESADESAEVAIRRFSKQFEIQQRLFN